MAAFNIKKLGFLTPLAVLVLILTLVNVVLTVVNQSLRMQLAERQQVINQSLQMEALHREIVTAVATVAVRTDDAELKSLLASQGINLDGAPKAPGGAK
jgi:predicted Holliday junction resolvase-like endonuclease